MNRIVDLQNAEPQLKLLRAREQLRSKLKLLSTFQVVLTVAIPAAGGAISFFRSGSRPILAAGALLITILDVWVLDRELRLLMKQMAQVAEQFDCVVFELPWDEFVAGEQAEIEEVHSLAAAFSARRSDSGLHNWYPQNVRELPLAVARLVCQRANLRYDSQLRRGFANLLKYIPICLGVALVVSGITMDQTLTSWILTMAPLTPILAWCVREYYRQSDAAHTSETLMKNAKELCRSTPSDNATSFERQLRSRELQTAIYLRRANSGPVPSFIYRSKRSRLEVEMLEGASHMVAEHHQSAPALESPPS